MNKSKNGHGLFASIFGLFHVHNERELQRQLEIESQTIPCFCCGREIAIERLKFIGGNPFCRSCR